MEYLKLVVGLVLTIVFIWLLRRNFKKSGFIPALLRLDTIGGIIAGLYLAVTSIHSLLI